MWAFIIPYTGPGPIKDYTHLLEISIPDNNARTNPQRWNKFLKLIKGKLKELSE